MVKVRNGVFETNSSMVHAMALLTDEEYNKWQEGEYYVSLEDSKLMTKGEAVQKIRNMYTELTYKEAEDFLTDWDYYTYDTFKDHSCYYEDFDDTYEKDGKLFHAVGYYGHD